MIINKIEPYEDDKGNQVIVSDDTKADCRVEFKGRNSKLYIEEGVTLDSVYIQFLGDNSTVRICSGTRYRGIISLGLSCHVLIGSDLNVVRNCRIYVAEKTTVEIGNDCMFAKNIEIRADDSHPIFDIESGKRINPSRSIYIGDHVWLGEHVCLLGGSRVGTGSVLGFRSVLKGTVPAHSIAVGSPAKVVKKNIFWEKTHLKRSKPYYFPTAEARPQDWRIKLLRPLVKRLASWRGLEEFEKNPRKFLLGIKKPHYKLIIGVLFP